MMKRMPLSRPRTLALPSLLLLAGALLPGKTKNDFDPDADYSKLATFSLVAGIDLSKTGIMDDPEKRMRIANFVSGILERRGMQEVPRDAPHDLAVRVWVAVRNRESVTTVGFSSTAMWGGYDPFWYGPWGYWYEQTIVENYIEGTLIIDLLNPQNKELVWRTYLKRDLKDREKAYGQMKKELDKAFREFPPSEKDKGEKRRERQRLMAKQ
jgi:hypothetical protein